jgi:IclR family acetate operon transcriptional repressor
MFSLGPSLVSVARLVLARGLPATARPYMRALAGQFGYTVNLAVLDGGEVLFIDVIESRTNLRMVFGIGTREPFHSDAVGKAIVAELDRAELHALLSRRPLRALTANTITSRAGLEAELQNIRERGYATDRGESQAGAHSVAAPIFGHRGVVGGIGLSAAADQLPEEDFPIAGAAVREAADAISAALGGRAFVPDSPSPR